MVTPSAAEAVCTTRADAHAPPVPVETTVRAGLTPLYPWFSIELFP